MKVIVNKYIPFSGFVAMAFYNLIFWRKEYEYKMLNKVYYDIVVNHESIHEAQMKDFCKWIPVGATIFYIIYILEWLFRVIQEPRRLFKRLRYRKINILIEKR